MTQPFTTGPDRLAMTVDGGEEAYDAGTSVAGEDEKVQTSIPLNEFQRNLPSVSAMKAELNAVAAKIMETTELLSTGRKKLEVVFYGRTP